MDSFITLKVDQFQDLFSDSIDIKIITLNNIDVDSDLLKFILELEAEHTFKKYTLFLSKTENNILNEYLQLYNFFKTLQNYHIEIKTVSINIPTYLFAVSADLTPDNFNIREYFFYD